MKFRLIGAIVACALSGTGPALANGHPLPTLEVQLGEALDSTQGRIRPASGYQFRNEINMRRCENAGVPRPPDFNCNHDLWVSAPGNNPPQSPTITYTYTGRNPAGNCVLTVSRVRSDQSGGYTPRYQGTGYPAYVNVNVVCTAAGGTPSCSYSRRTNWAQAAVVHPSYHITFANQGGRLCPLGMNHTVSNKEITGFSGSANSNFNLQMRAGIMSRAVAP